MAHQSGAAANRMRLIGADTALGRSLQLSSASFLGAVLAFATSLVVAASLGPAALGRAGAVILMIQYAGRLRAGFIDGGYREWLSADARGDVRAAREFRSVAVTAELATVLVPVLWLSGSALAGSSTFFRLGLVIATATVVAMTIDRIGGALHFSANRIGDCARNRAIVAAGTPILTLALLPVAGAFALLLAPLLANLLSLAAWYWLSPAPDLNWNWNPRAAIRLAHIGFPVALGSLIGFGLQAADRTVAAMAFDEAALGQYLFGSAIVMNLGVLVADLATVATQRLWRQFAETSLRESKATLLRFVVWSGLLTASLALLLQIAYPVVVLLLLPKFGPSIKVVQVLALSLGAAHAMILPTIVLTSRELSRQWALLVVQAAVAVVTIGAGFGVALWAHQPALVASVGVIGQAAAAFGAMMIVRRVAPDLARGLVWLAFLPLLVLVASSSAMSFVPLRETAGLLGATAARLAVASAVALPGCWITLRMVRQYES